MSKGRGERLFTTRLDEAALAGLIALGVEEDERWCFVEGPTASGFWPEGRRPDQVMIGKLWSVRLFGPESELAARRLDFENERPWQVRWCGQERPDEGWREHTVLGEEIETCELWLFAQDGKRDVTFGSDSDATGPAVRRAPGVATDKVDLVVSTLHPADGKGAVRRWVEIKDRIELEHGKEGLSDEQSSRKS